MKRVGLWPPPHDQGRDQVPVVWVEAGSRRSVKAGCNEERNKCRWRITEGGGPSSRGRTVGGELGSGIHLLSPIRRCQRRVGDSKFKFKKSVPNSPLAATKAELASENPTANWEAFSLTPNTLLGTANWEEKKFPICRWERRIWTLLSILAAGEVILEGVHNLVDELAIRRRIPPVPVASVAIKAVAIEERRRGVGVREGFLGGLLLGGENGGGIDGPSDHVG
ncbi:uncharacterized protein G2W53_008128 [Senna tora]|uniref:Uncharacterized protein n=1 Tax=Senna tora TaxID=362788 RepID=A0A834X7A8_9FABA|nr:uncharacterized protein G2W53_008128 [Senna tora]